MKKFLALLLALAMIFALAACGAKEAPAAPAEKPAEAPAEKPVEAPVADADPLAALDPIVIEFPIPNADANIETEYTQKWIDKVEEVSNGKITFNFTPGGALGNYDELIEATINGVYDMTIAEPSNLVSYVPESSILNLPMLLSSYEECDWVFDGEVGQWWEGLVEEAVGLVPMNYYYCGFRYIVSQGEIKTLDDIPGMIIRSPGAQNYLDTLGMLGFACETMAFSEAYSAMENGVINAAECPLQNLWTSGYYNLCDYLLCTRHIFSENCIFANKEFLDSLAPEYLEILESTLAEITAEERVECDAREQQFMKDFEGQGTTINEFDAETQAAVVAKFTDYWSQKAAELGDDAVAKLQLILDHKG